MIGTPDLEKDILAFVNQKAELHKAHKDKFALVVNGKFVNAFDSEQAAYECGIRQFGDVQMLVTRITEKEQAEAIPSLSLGLLGANL